MSRLPVYVRDLGDGRVAVALVDFPEVIADGGGLDAALAALESRAAARVQRSGGALRIGLLTDRELQLSTVSVVVIPKGSKRDEITVAVTAVSWRQSSGVGEMHVVRVPGVPAVDLAVARPGDVVSSTSRAVAGAVREWFATAVLALHEPVPGRLEWINVPFVASGAVAGGTDDAFSLEAAAEELTRLSASGRLGRLDQRDPIVERVLAALAAPGRSSVLLVGPRDVGKSALVGEVAARIAGGDVPPALQGRSLWKISANDLVAGARFIGMWQGRARALVAHARAEGAIYVMGDPVAIVDAGRWSESSNNLSRVLRPAIESGELSVICETTADALSAVTAKEPSFVEAFHRVDLQEPVGDVVSRILEASADRMSAAHGIEFDPGASVAAIELTRRFEPYAALPGKAVRLLEDVVQRTVGLETPDVIDREDVIAAFAQRSGLPRSVVSDEVTLDLSETAAFLERRVLGQPAAVEAMVDLLATIKAGLQSEGKPLGSFFFVGPTGVGKTELAKAVAELLFSSRDRMLRFDMGEYKSGDALAKLIGSGWRSGEEGELTRQVREQPFSVLLLDEIEKAHSDVFDALLSVLGEGRLTDSSGRTADFRNAVVIMTSNLGATGADRQGVGFASGGEPGDARRQRFVDAAETFFRPEFFNRIDEVVVFNSLEQDTIKRIARREIGRLVMREGITRRQLLVEVEDAVIEHCADAGFHPRYGARPLQRQIERSVSRPLARLVVAERPQPGDLISFRMADGKVSVELHRPAEAEPEVRSVPSRGADQITFERVAHDLKRLRERLSGQAEDPVMQSLALELDRLLSNTHEPGFWDDPDGARAVLARYYQLERCFERFATLRSRIDGLDELLAAIRRRRQPARLAEARDAIAEIDTAAELLWLEITGAAAGSDGNTAYITVTGVGALANEWASDLTGMYAAWAERTGREARRTGDEAEVQIEGISSYLLLRAESGLHRWVDDEHASILARVSVRQSPREDDREGATIVRQYYQGRRQFVRDPRTGVRVNNVEAVLNQGAIDAFLIAATKARSNAT